MILLPAIDILGGKCVRLTKGAYETAQTVAADPVETAISFQSAGAEYIHMVDLDGAREGSRVNSSVYTSVVHNVHIPVEVGGGIRDIPTIEYYLEKGITRVILGSAALKDRPLVVEAVKRYGDRIAVGIDALNRTVRTSGWLEDSEVDYIRFAKKMENVGVKTIIFTDISKDGTLAGPNYEQLKELSESVSCDIVASGGIRDISHIERLAAMNLYGAICGKSIYSGTLNLEEAIKMLKSST